MATIRTNLRDVRRRRALVDDKSTEKTVATYKRNGGVTGNPSARGYTDFARREELPSVCDLIPQRLWSLSIWWLSGMVASMSVLLLALLQLDGKWRILRVMDPLDPTRADSFSTWMMTCLFLGCSTLSAYIFAIRRHRIDDYRGRYRMWVYATVYFLLASMFCTVDAKTGVATVVQSQLPTFSGSLPRVHHMLGAIVAFAVLLRMAFEVRKSTAALIGLAVSAAFLGASLLLSSFQIVPEILSPYLGHVSRLVSSWFLTLSLLSYARYVTLDAHGQLQSRPANKKFSRWKLQKSKTQNGSASDGESARNVIPLNRQKTDKSTSTEPSKKGESGASSSIAVSADNQDMDESTSAHLSKADRKRLRKEKRRQRRAA